MKVFVLTVVMLMIFCGCATDPTQAQVTMLDRTLLRIAKEHILKNRPEWGYEIDHPYSVRDKGSYWEVVFSLPAPKDGELVLGGVPVVWIEKESMKVIRLYHTQ